MCGIHLSIATTTTATTTTALHDTPVWLHRRGPDSCKTVQWQSGTKTVTLQASVLAMHPQLVVQPVQICDNVYLAWNGEIYNNAVLKSDTLIIQELLQAALAREKGTTSDDIMDILCSILSSALLVNAEFAFCLVTKDSIYYGKDAWGRRSLLVNRYSSDGKDCDDENISNSTLFAVASVATNNTTTTIVSGYWTEVPPGRVYAYKYNDAAANGDTNAALITSKAWKLSSVERRIQVSTTVTNHIEASIVLEELLRKAVYSRLKQQGYCSYNDATAGGGKNGVSVLFSGGVDSVVIAALAWEFCIQHNNNLTKHSSGNDGVKTLSLVNISFARDHTGSANHGNKSTQTIAADTLAAQASFRDLQQRFGDTNDDNNSDTTAANVVLIQHQVTLEEVQRAQPHIQGLIHPKDADVMDINIATALYFAAQAAPDRLILSGLGADELLGGYKRHATAYKIGGYDKLRQELILDQERLWERNLGRDDRVISDCSKEVRYPFLDPYVVQYLSSIKLDHIVNFDGHDSIDGCNIEDTLSGDKYVLRLVARRLGLHSASTAVKRAIQFGSRLSQTVDAERYGSRRKATRHKKK